MELSNDLISQFVRVTKEDKPIKETTVYGTIVIQDNKQYVQLDGSNLVTPFHTTTDLAENDRVTVMIKDHNAVVTGNMTSPSAKDSTVKAISKKVNIHDSIIANSVSAAQFQAEVARIDTLVSENTTIKSQLNASEAIINRLDADNVAINDKLTATEASIESLSTTKLDTEVADITYATIKSLQSAQAEFNSLKSAYGIFYDLTTERLDAAEAAIGDLDTNKLDAAIAEITYAKIADLNAINADVNTLDADLAKISTLIFGTASGETIQASFANAVIAQLGDAQIKSAMVESISASKITSGDVITNNIRVKSNDGKLLISDETIQISDGTRVRVQIGKDSSNDYSINIWDNDGNLMFSKGGITDNAIKEAIIRNDMVSDTANISAYKLNIDSLFEVINGSDNTIKSTRVYLDDEKQTLDVAFKTLESNATELNKTVSSQGTEINAIQGQISSKVWLEDMTSVESVIDDKVTELSNQYSTLEQESNNISALVASHTTAIENKADSSTVTTINDKVTKLEENLSGFETSVSTTYATKNEVSIVQNKVDKLEVGGRNLLLNTKVFAGDNITGSSTLSNDLYKDFNIRIYDNTKATNGYVDMTTFDGIYVDELGSAYTLSFYAKGVVESKLLTFFYGTTNYVQVAKTIQSNGVGSISPDGKSEWALTENWKRYWVTWFLKDVGDINAEKFVLFRLYFGGSAEICGVKLEKGNKASDWSPAPEDVEASISDVVNVAEDLEKRVTIAESKIIQNDSSIRTLVDRTEVVENKFAGYSTTESMNSAIAQSAQSITSSISQSYATKSEFENLKIGGRNLISGSDETREYSGNASGLSTGYKDVWTGKTISIPTETEYIVSFDAKADVAQTIRCFFFSPNTTTSSLSSTGQTSSGADGAATVTLTTDWARYWVKWTQTPATDQKNIIIGRNYTENDIYIRAVKLESGHTPSHWTPAPEDMASSDDLATVQSSSDMVDTRLSIAESLIEQLSDSLAVLVRDENGESLMVQTENGWTFSTSQIQSAVDAASEKLSDLTNDVGDTNSVVSALQQAVTDLGILNDYVKIRVYEDEPCIELGESDSDFKLLITNTRIMFMEGSGLPAYLSNQSLFIKKAVIEEELQQGEFMWKVRSNGNLGLIWKGATS